MFEKEQELVEIGSHSYNLKEGGNGGWDHINDGSIEHIERCKRGGHFSRKNFTENDSKLLKKRLSLWHTKEHLKIMREKAWSSGAIEKRKETFQKIRHACGNNNSQYGTMWITNEFTNKKIKNDDVIPEGWRKGRVLK